MAYRRSAPVKFASRAVMQRAVMPLRSAPLKSLSTMPRFSARSSAPLQERSIELTILPLARLARLRSVPGSEQRRRTAPVRSAPAQK